ncbi:MAG: hypothetical protein WC752_02210 [Patescibacteria group bacterium]|jgi:hypothetical protein
MDNKNIDWDDIYRDPQIRAVAQSRYAELNKEREDLGAQMKEIEEEMRTWQKAWKNILERRLIMEQKIRAKDKMIRHVFPVQPPAITTNQQPVIKNQQLFSNTEKFIVKNEQKKTVSQQPIAPSQPSANVNLKPVPKVGSNTALDELKAAKLEEASLRQSPTATALDIATLQEKIKSLTQKLNTQTSTV